jgi:hypothetical protein
MAPTKDTPPADDAPTEPGLPVSVTRDVPPITVEVLPGNTVSEGDQVYYGEGYPFAPEGHTGNDQVTLDGPTAIALVQAGHVRIVGSE